MAQYIDKDAVVAEIERRIKALHSTLNERETAVKIELKDFLSFIDTLEVKEVDLEKELNDYGYHYDYVSLADRKELVDFAKHFFELGMRSTITKEDCKLIWNIGDEIPNMPEEEFFKELLRRYKAKKGEEV